MPAFSTHFIFAEEMMNALKDTADFTLNEDAVYLGAQGPDIFFFHRSMPWMPGRTLRKTGSLIHRIKPSVLLESMRSYTDISSDRNIALSYVWGFILHYSLDRKCHPYVYAYQDKIVKANRFTNPHTAHNLIEFAMDSFLLNKRLKITDTMAFKTAETVSVKPDILFEIAKLYEYVLPKTIGMNISKNQIVTAFKDTKYIQKITNDKSGIKRIFLTPIDYIIAPFSKNFKFTAMIRPGDLEKAKKYANIENNVWVSPYSGEKHTQSFEDLFIEAKGDALNMIKDFKAGKSAAQITNNLSFLTGVEVK